MSPHLPQRYQYILLRTSPSADELALRLALQESLAQSFGLTASGGPIDVLWVAPAPAHKDGTGKCVVRVANGPDASRLLAAVVASSATPRMELIRASSFLPSLLVEDDPL